MPLLPSVRREIPQVRIPGPSAFPALAVLLVLSAVWLGVPRAVAQPKLTTYESRYYKIHTNLTREEAVDFGAHMDLIFAEYDRMLKSLRGKAFRKQDMYLCRTQADYLAVLRGFGIEGEGSGGMYWYRGNATGLATFVEGRERGEVFATLQHEGFHQFAFIKTRGNLPIWVNEGLAEYFGDAAVVAGKVKHGIVDADRLRRVRDALDTKTAIPFDQMLTINSQRWFANFGSPQGALQYDQAWSIVHFLIHADKRFERAFSRYLGLLSEGKYPAHAFADAFGSNDPAPFERRYLRFIEELEPDPYGAALTRMRFLAAGLEHLQGKGEPTPEDLDALKQNLQRRGFTVVSRSHGGEHVRDSRQDHWFGYDDAKGQTHAFVLEAPRGKGDDNPDTPPDIVAAHLSPPARLTWVRYQDGSLQTQMSFGRKR